MSDLGRTGLILAARTGSSRLPGKALLPLNGVPMAIFLLRRLRGARHVHRTILATTTLAEDDKLASLAEAEGVQVFRGSETDLVARFVHAAEGLDTVVRVTGDCPFVNAEILDYCLESCGAFDNFDLATTKGAFPVGIDFEIYHAATLAALHETASLTPAQREHLTLYFYDHPDRFDIRVIEPRADWRLNGARFTVDTREDYAFAQTLVTHLDDPDFSIARLAQIAKTVPR